MNPTPCLDVAREGAVVTITMDLPERRNALGQRHLDELLAAFRDVAAGDATGVVLAGNGTVFCAGHDLGEMAGADAVAIGRLLETCRSLMMCIATMPQVVVARVHALATAAGCQLVAAADLAVASTEASFAVPGGRGGWFCTTPMVAVGRAVPRKRAFELALCGDPIDARTALDWGLVNRVVDPADLDAATMDLLGRATRGSAASRAIGKAALTHQLGLPLDEAYRYATEVMTAASQIADAREAMAAFVEKRPPVFSGR